MMWRYQSGKRGAGGTIRFNAIPRLQNYLIIPTHVNKGWRYMADKTRTQEKSKKAMTKKARLKKKKVKS